jgi:hypothetical protein
MKFFQIKKGNESDYKNLLSIFAELNVQSFSELSECQQKELVGAWMSEDDNEDEVLNCLLDIKNSGVLAEAMYESIKPRDLGDVIIQKFMSGDVIRSINLDLDEAFGEHLMSLDKYSSDEDAHRLIDNIDRVKYARMGF